MAIQFGNDKIKEIYVGSDKIKEVYCGSELVYTAHDPRGYWVHKDTGVKTYFGLEDPSIEDGIMGYPSWMPNCSEVKLPSGVTGFKTYNWVYEEYNNMKFTYNGFVHTKETVLTGNAVLISVDLSNTSITSIGSYCFFGCSSLTSITLPESVTSLWESCFYGCTSLTSITLPAGVTSLWEGCFYRCTSLTSITIPESVTTLGNSCFSGCTSLTSINIPAGVTSLGKYCFDGCSSLILATVLPAIPPSLGNGVFSGVHTSFNIKVRSPYVNAYKSATGWSAYADKISAI